MAETVAFQNIEIGVPLLDLLDSRCGGQLSFVLASFD